MSLGAFYILRTTWQLCKNIIGLNMSFLPVTTAAVLLCLSGDFDSQLRHILHEQMFDQDPADVIISRVLDDVRTTLSQRWQGFKLIPYGSVTTGAGTKSSDIDINLHLRNFNISSASSVTVIEETKQLFQQQPALYTDINGALSPKYSRFSFFHIPTQRNVDLTYHLFNYEEEALGNTKIMKYYFNLDERILPLVRFLKYFFKIHGLVVRESKTLNNHALYLLIVFYLQQKNMAPPVYVLQKDAISHYLNIWNIGFNELPYSTTNTENLHQLLGGFFKYYSEFNFEENIVAPFSGRPISRSAFTDIDNFPKEYTLYNNTLKRTAQHKIKKDLNCTDVCIQNVFEHNSNVGKRVTHEYATKFKYLMKSVAIMFEDLPSDSILRTILVTDQHKENVINYNNAAVDGINERDCIKVPDASYRYNGNPGKIEYVHF